MRIATVLLSGFILSSSITSHALTLDPAVAELAAPFRAVDTSEESKDQAREEEEELLSGFSLDEINFAMQPSDGDATESDGTDALTHPEAAQVRSYLAKGQNPQLLHLARRSTKSAPIWRPFIGNFRQCASGCVPSNFSTFGKRAKRSCHDTGRAVDVGAIVCRGRVHKAIAGGRFSTFVQCMSKRMKIIYRNGRHITAGHRDHVHISNGCTLPGGRKYY